MAVTTSKGDGYALYNGIKLPYIDSVWTDKVTYPYAVISDVTSLEQGFTYALFFLRDRPSFDGSDVTSGSNNNTSTYSAFAMYGDEWEFYYGEVDYDWFLYIVDPIWTSHNILNNTDNTVYLSASDPISLDGYNVIEWDGDTTGLVNPAGTGVYRVSDFLDKPSSVYCVFKMSSSDNFLVNSHIVERSQLGAAGWGMGEQPSYPAFAAISCFAPDNSVGVESGLYFYKNNDGSRTYLLAYRSTETPPDEGGGYDKTAFLSGMAMGLIGKGDPTFTGGGASGNMLYNGVELPDINTVWADKTTYPYACLNGSNDALMDGSGISIGVLYLSEVPIYCDLDGFVRPSDGSSFMVFHFDPTGVMGSVLGSWTYDNDNTSGTNGLTWTSHDVLNTSDNTVYLAASDTVPAGGTDAFTKGYLTGAELRRKRVIPASTPSANGDGFALYNGEKWPSLPANDLSAFPYAYMVDGSEYYDYVAVVLYYSDKPAYWYNYEGTTYYGWNADGTVLKGYAYIPSSTDMSNGFTFRTEEVVGDGYHVAMASLSAPIGRPVWCNVDVVLPNGSVYLAASDPIPLDGYNVIEWDGDTTGLESINGIYYKISPDVPPVSAGDTVIVAMDTNVTDTPRYGIDTAFNAEGYTISTLGTDEAVVIWGSGEMGTGLFFYNANLGERYARITLFAYKA